MESSSYSLIILCIIAFLLIISYHQERKRNIIKYIPKIIWTYWDDENNIPESVYKCMDTWSKYNPDYTIHLVLRRNLHFFLPDVDILNMKMATTPQRTSDFVRLFLLERYGGVWCDATIMLTGKLNYDSRNEEFIGYHIEHFNIKYEWPVIENWFFACPPKSDFISKWKNTFIKINNFDTSDDYVNYIKNLGVYVDGIDGQNYLTMHVAAQYVIQKMMSWDDINTKLSLQRAEDGPFRHMVQNDWNGYEGVKSLCNNDKEKSIVIKFRGGEREIIDKHPEIKSCLFNSL